MKAIRWVLLGFTALLQYQLWVVPGGITTYWDLQEKIKQQTDINQQWQKKNAFLSADINDLKQGTQAVEERAREQLGMVKPGEVFYQVQGAN